MRSSRRIFEWALWFMFIALVSFVLGITLFKPRIYQPLPFNHQKHQKVACVICHRGVESQKRAGLPDMDTCLNCHVTPPFKTKADIKVWNAAVEKKHISWKIISQIPPHVYYSHRRHVAMGQLDCAICHGDMTNRTIPPTRILKTISMNNCWNCHLKEKVINDCARCHR